MVSNKLLLILIAAGVGWVLAGEPTNVTELRSGINKLLGKDDGSQSTVNKELVKLLEHKGDKHHGRDFSGMPIMPPIPPGGDPTGQLAQMQQQNMQQQMQQQMQEQQTQFQNQLSQQQLQSQIAQIQAQAQAAAGGAGGGAGIGQQMMPNPAAATAAATQDPSTLPGSTVPASQQMLPSQQAPGIVPQTMQADMGMMAGMMGGMSGMPGMGGMTNPMMGAYGGMGGYPMGGYGGGYGGYGGFPIGGGGGYPGGLPMGAPGSIFGGGATPMQTMFASAPNTLGNYQNTNIRSGFVPTQTKSPYVRQQYTGYTPHASYTPTYRAHMGIVDTHEHHMEHHRPFFNNPQELMNFDIGQCYPGMDGITLSDLLLSSESKSISEIFPNGINKHSFGSFSDDINQYITKILRKMAFRSPEEKVRILKDVLLTKAASEPPSSVSEFYPDPTNFQNTLAKVPRSMTPHIKDSMANNEESTYVNTSGYMLPDKYAVLQFKNSNSMPPFLHARGGKHHHHHKNVHTRYGRHYAGYPSPHDHGLYFDH